MYRIIPYLRLNFSRNFRLTKCFVLVVATICFFFILTSYQAPVTEHEEIPSPEIRKFAFMKVHKCGSSTIENIIFRFAYYNDLNVVLPASGNYLSTKELFNHSSLQKTKWKDVPFDIFSLHNRWNRKEVMTLLKEEVPTFAIVRDPVDVFVSMFYYLGSKMKQFYGVGDILDLVHMIQYTSHLPILQKRWSGFIGRNQMAWDMGLSPEIFDNKTAIQKEIERLDTEFDLVMVSNRMDESLILLKELLHWPIENVAHLDLNRRKPDKLHILNTEERGVLAQWLSADVQIFEYFSRRLDERISELNKKHEIGFLAFFRQSFLKKELQLLNEAKNNLYDRCVIGEVGNENLTGKFKETNDNILGYLINEDHKGCELYAMSEPAYLKVFRTRLLQRTSRKSSKAVDLFHVTV